GIPASPASNASTPRAGPCASPTTSRRRPCRRPTSSPLYAISRRPDGKGAPAAASAVRRCASARTRACTVVGNGWAQGELMETVDPEQHVAEVLATFDNAPSPRLAELMKAAVRHLHAFVEETRLTREEWFAAIQFLTEVGHKCDARRQEFILLSDTLGVSMLV